MAVKGIAFPLAIDPVRGNLAIASDGDLVRGHITSWLLTELKERVMRPNYGMKDYLFDSVQDINNITVEIEEGLKDYIQETQFQVNGEINDAGESLINVYWAYEGVEDNLSVQLN